MKKALLVIDMQEFTVGENHANIFKYPGDIVARVNKVIDEKVKVSEIRSILKAADYDIERIKE